MITIDYVQFIGEGSKHLEVELATQLRNLGCFIFVNCFPVEEVDYIHQALEKLFSLSEPEKMQYYVDKRANPLGNGFSPYGVSRALDTKIPNLLETWDISLDRSMWPVDLQDEWQAIIYYQQRLKEISIASLEIMADALGVSRKELVSIVDINDPEGIHLIHYFPVEKEHDPNARRQSEHYDNTLLTLIPAPNPVHTGIEVFSREDEEWQHLEIQLGSCLVQAGLILEMVTSNSIGANLHTVKNPTYDSVDNGHRYSTPFFVSPKRDAKVSILPSLINGHDEQDTRAIEEVEQDYFNKIFGNQTDISEQ